MKQRLENSKRLSQWLVAALAWIWITGILAAYIHGFTDTIQLLLTWLWETEITSRFTTLR